MVRNANRFPIACEHFSADYFLICGPLFQNGRYPQVFLAILTIRCPVAGQHSPANYHRHYEAGNPDQRIVIRAPAWGRQKPIELRVGSGQVGLNFSVDESAI